MKKQCLHGIACAWTHMFIMPQYKTINNIKLKYASFMRYCIICSQARSGPQRTGLSIIRPSIKSYEFQNKHIKYWSVQEIYPGKFDG